MKNHTNLVKNKFFPIAYEYFHPNNERALIRFHAFQVVYINEAIVSFTCTKKLFLIIWVFVSYYLSLSSFYISFLNCYYIMFSRLVLLILLIIAINSIASSRINQQRGGGGRSHGDGSGGGYGKLFRKEFTSLIFVYQKHLTYYLSHSM